MQFTFTVKSHRCSWSGELAALLKKSSRGHRIARCLISESVSSFSFLLLSPFPRGSFRSGFRAESESRPWCVTPAKGGWWAHLCPRGQCGYEARLLSEGALCHSSVNASLIFDQPLNFHFLPADSFPLRSCGTLRGRWSVNQNSFLVFVRVQGLGLASKT